MQASLHVLGCVGVQVLSFVERVSVAALQDIQGTLVAEQLVRQAPGRHFSSSTHSGWALRSYWARVVKQISHAGMGCRA